MKENHTLIIAEAGVNHNGSIDIALELVDVAAEAGVDYVKFQTFKTENLVSKAAKLATYQARNLHSASSDSQFDMLKRLELSNDAHAAIIERCKLRGIKFLSTAFDLDSIEYLDSLKLGLWKIPSGEITNYPYLRNIARFASSNSDKIVMSTGMSTIEDIASALKVLYNNGVDSEQVTLLHCNTQYPTPMQDVNLRAMESMRKQFGVAVGYSDHTKGIEVPIAAVALGATTIEKHFTLDCSLPGPDHKASLEPDELKAMVSAIRNIEQALGSSRKCVSPSEQSNIAAARKSIVAARHIAKGEKFTEENICVKRPSCGLSPMLWNEVIGTVADKEYFQDQLISIKR